jgi:mono/diheme cytochrome c family protein
MSIVRSLTTAGLALALAAACGGGSGDAPAQKAPAASTPAPAATVASAADSMGRAVYGTCTACHQANGQGIPNTYPPLAGAEHLLGTPEIPIAIVLHGLQGPVKVAGKDYNNVMNPWGGVFNDAQVAAVLTYARSQWGNNAPAITADQVAKVRAATASRTTPWTIAELRAFKF